MITADTRAHAVYAALKANKEHDWERMSCLDHESKCCPAGDAHEMDYAQAQEHQAAAVVDAVLEVLGDLIAKAIEAGCVHGRVVIPDQQGVLVNVHRVCYRCEHAAKIARGGTG